ncbi:MAG: serine/threonine-protein kinase [Planctomycetota bacterium]
MEFDWTYRSIARPEIPGVEELEHLGQGGMGNVYRGRDALGRPVAVKVARRMSQAALARFEREAQLLARFRAPEVVTAHAWGVTDDLAYLVTELVEGQTLDEAAKGRSFPERVELWRAVVRAVAVAHRAGVVHRDLKPSNVLVTAEGQVRLIDFGVSIGLDQERLTLSGGAIGTPAYMAPEQFKRVDPSPTQDVWSLGVLGYELLGTRLPFDSQSLMAIAAAQEQGPPPLGREVPRRLERVTLRALRYAPCERYADADALDQAIEEALAPGDARPAWLVGGLLGAAALCLAVAVYARRAHPTNAVSPVASDAAATGPQDAAGVDPGLVEREPAADERWPVPWSGTLTPEEATRLQGLTAWNAEDDLELLETLAPRGQPKAMRLLGLALVVGMGDHERDRPRGYWLLVKALRHGSVAAANDLLPLFVGPEIASTHLRYTPYPQIRAELGTAQDLDLAAALALLARDAGGPKRVLTGVMAEFERLGVRLPESQEAAFALVQERLASVAEDAPPASRR